MILVDPQLLLKCYRMIDELSDLASNGYLDEFQLEDVDRLMAEIRNALGL